ncbi:hypothetical protein [Methanomethylophilus alvi]|uniref:hypothetical protein n=1 Tax=Methanomethylophilus alvi TaxID=1291540 RepID=UPI0037DCB5CD
MSHQEQATLEYAGACKQMLDEAQKQLQQILESAKATVEGSSSLMDSTLESMMGDLSESATEMMRSISQRRDSMGSTAYRIEIDSTRQFLSAVNSVVLKSNALQTAIRGAFISKMESHTQYINGLDEYLASITDEKLRKMIGLLARNKAHKDLSLEELRELAESKLDPSKKVRRKLVNDTVVEVRERMVAEKVSAENIEKVSSVTEEVSPLEIMDSATTEIFDERLRRSAVQAIVKSISAKGFIVKKENIRHIKETDTVKITAMKPGGQKAEFSIDLTGKFMYHFQGYEGQACQKDISPLERDLEEVYGIKLTDKKTIWDNPDKLTQSHHAEMKVRGDS